MTNSTRRTARVKPAKYPRTSHDSSSNSSPPTNGCRRDSYERLLAVMQAAVDREASQQIDWDAEWGDQREED
jgi:hypothetical protein